MMAHKDKTVDGLTKGVAYLFKKNNVDHIRGDRITSYNVCYTKLLRMVKVKRALSGSKTRLVGPDCRPPVSGRSD